MNDKIWAFALCTLIVGVAMALGLPGAEALANIVIGGILGATNGQDFTKKGGI